jgi:hypothetical protein
VKQTVVSANHGARYIKLTVVDATEFYNALGPGVERERSMSIASGVTGTISVGPNNRTMTAESGAWGPPNRL